MTKRWSKSSAWLFVSLLMVTCGASLQASTRPVSIGVNANYEQNLARSANLGWSRIDIVWSFINPQPGVWNFSGTDAQINNANAAGQQVLGILHDPPQWVGGGSNANIPPLSTTEWSEFVRRVAQRYAGKIAAYEIWNEPDQKSTSQFGIGWGRSIEEPPLYVDFVHAAAVQIRTYAPGTLVVAPAFMSRNNAYGADNRKKRILEQIQAANYSGSPGYSFVDVFSAHNNAGSDEPSKTMGYRLYHENLAYIIGHAPSLRYAPDWVTEYGWRSNAVGESSQREKICNETKIYTGLLEASTTHLDQWDVTRAFIFLLKDPNSSASIFRSDGSPKLVVTQYLQKLAYPATQNPAYSADYPSCSGTSAPITASGVSDQPQEDPAASLAVLGLGDPRPALPEGYSELYSDRSPDGGTVDLAFENPAGDVISVSVSPASAENRARSFLGDGGAEWTVGSSHVSLAGLRAGSAQGKALFQSLGAALDPSFGQTCMTESVLTSDDKEVRRLGYSPPVAPPGFKKVETVVQFTHPTSACSGDDASRAQMIDFSWRFENKAGEGIRAGIYHYDTGSDVSAMSARSLHWSDANGTRFWVAAETAEVTPKLEDQLYRVAESMDPELRR